MYRHPSKQPPFTHRGTVAIAACVVDLNGHVPAEIQLTPSGHFRARDGRPSEVLAGWYIDATIAQRVIARSINTAGDFVIDYEHQTLHTEKNGQPAPAGGWWTGANMEWRDGQGLFATNIDWTDAAKAAIAAKEYRYISPVLAYDKQSGHVLAILMAALTNYPAIEGLSDLTAMAAAKFDFTPHHEEENPVKREQLIALLGLATDASDELIQQAITALKAQASANSALRTNLALADDADLVATVAALKTTAEKNGEPDPARYVPIAAFESLKTEVATLKADSTTKAVDELVEEGLDSGKLHPDQEEWARKYGNNDIAGLKAYLEKTPAIAALKGTQTRGKQPDGTTANGELDEEAVALCAQMGIDPEDYKKTLAG